MMSPSSRMGDEQIFWQRWEFRRKDDGFDSSSDDSKSNSVAEPVLKEHNLASGFISFDNDETSNTSRLQPNLNNDSGFEGQFQFEKAEEKKIKRSKKNNVASSEVKKDSHEEVHRKKSKTSAYDHLAATSDVKSFTVSLLEDLRATRENLFTWMREEINKLIADDTAPRKRRRNGASRGKKVQSPQQNNSENMKVQPQKNFKKKLKFQRPKTSGDSMQEQHLNGDGAIIHMQQQNNIEKDTEVECQNNFDKGNQMHHRNNKDNQVQHQNNFKSGMRAPNCNGRFLESFVKSTKADDANNQCQALDDQVDFGKATESITSVDKEKKERLALSSNSKFQSSSSNQRVTVQHPKSVVLAIRAQNCNDGSSKRSVAGKKRADSDKLYQVPEDRTGSSRSMASCEKDRAKRLRLPVEQNFTLNPSNHVASSMYLTLPTVFTEPPVLNSKFDTSLCNFIQPRVDGNKTTVNLERANQVLDSSTHCGYLPSIQKDERGGEFAQVVSRNMSTFDQNGILSSGTGTGFPVPLHQSLGDGFSSPGQFYFENLHRENCNTLGLRMNGGATTFSGENYALSDHLHSHPNHKADFRFLPYQIPSTRDGYVFPK
ncbi:hypothetical protein Pint_15148 [Pistacia integerrima]|uniref:Uncharacterized protein n=1 Tax=Pistacia integerrima TaxID=434235 RepID=A0ACC0ZAA7_9ROSI|nr:hypothetical protein Pint_15148 [Pistacia integerrima]